jgi:hypothetical protein
MLALMGTAGIGLAGASVFGSRAAVVLASAPTDWFNVKDAGAVGDGVTDDTTQVQAALTAAASSGGTVYFPPGRYRIEGALSAGTVTLLGTNGSILEHYPPDDSTDCLTITGADAGRTKISGLTFKGLQNSHTFGRDLLRIKKGDYVVLEDLYLVSPKRDALHVEPGADFQWIENMLLLNVKSQSAKRDAFHFELPSGLSTVFINQTTMINCESRSSERYALALINANTSSSAAKISCFKVINTELAGSTGTTEPIVKISGPASGGVIENVSFQDSVIEDTTNSRQGPAVHISGSMSGLFHFDNSNTYGTAGGAVVGFELFPHYHYRTITSSASVPLYSSHMGLYKKYRTASLAQNGYEDAYTLQDGEILKGYVLDRYNTGNWYAEFTCWDTNGLFVAVQQGLTVTINAGTLRITNTSATSASLELFLQRVTKDTAF